MSCQEPHRATNPQAKSETWQCILDACLELADRRRHAIDRLNRGFEPAGVTVESQGPDLTSWTLRQSRTWTHLLSTRPVTTTEGLSRSMPNNRMLLRNGLTMVSVFDTVGTDHGARDILRTEDDDAYLFSSAPLMMRVVDHEQVLMHGDRQRLISLRGRAVIDAAHRYWSEVIRVASPCRELHEEHDGLTARQVTVLNLLRRGSTDDQVARVLGLSVRTIRSEVGDAMTSLDAHSRFAAGYRYAMLARESEAASAVQ